MPNALRDNGKKAVLLAYPNEGHHLAGLANRRVLTVRFMEFFDHYLKGAPSPGCQRARRRHSSSCCRIFSCRLACAGCPARLRISPGSC